MPTQPTFTCATCDVQIAHHPVFHLGLAFCCAGCAADGPCMCSYDVEVGPTAAVRLVAAATVAAVVPAPAALSTVTPAEAPAESEAAPGVARRRSAARRRADERPLVDARG